MSGPRSRIPVKRLLARTAMNNLRGERVWAVPDAEVASLEAAIERVRARLATAKANGWAGTVMDDIEREFRSLEG